MTTDPGVRKRGGAGLIRSEVIKKLDLLKYGDMHVYFTSYVYMLYNECMVIMDYVLVLVLFSHSINNTVCTLMLSNYYSGMYQCAYMYMYIYKLFLCTHIHYTVYMFMYVNRKEVTDLEEQVSSAYKDYKSSVNEEGGKGLAVLPLVPINNSFTLNREESWYTLIIELQVNLGKTWDNWR